MYFSPFQLSSSSWLIRRWWYTQITSWENTTWEIHEFKKHFYLLKHWYSCLGIHSLLNWNGLIFFSKGFPNICNIKFYFPMLKNCSLQVLCISLGTLFWRIAHWKVISLLKLRKHFLVQTSLNSYLNIS